jgi:hypothetical protein
MISLALPLAEIDQKRLSEVVELLSQTVILLL